MKIYTRVVFDMASGRVEEADSYEYDGAVAHCGGKGKAPAAPDYSQVMREDMEFRKAQYEQMKPLMERSLASAEKVSDRQLELMNENAIREKEQYERQRSAFAPTELQVAADAYGQQYLSADEKAQLREAVSPDSGLSEEERNKRLSAFGDLAEGRASTEAMGQAQAAANMAAGQQGRMLGRFGANPAKMAAISQRLQNEQALNLTNAGNAARTGVRNQGVALRANLANMGRGFINSSAQLGSLASQQGGAAMNALGSGIGSYMQAGSGMTQGFSNQASMMGQQYGQTKAAWDANQEKKSSSMAGIGSLVGTVGGFMVGGPAGAMVGSQAGGALGSAMAADGGMIRGPGTGTSDSVRAINTDNGQPIRVSNGEYILPADTVRSIGKGALDRIVSRTHAPVRRALRA